RFSVKSVSCFSGSNSLECCQTRRWSKLGSRIAERGRLLIAPGLMEREIRTDTISATLMQRSSASSDTD
ncbi:hypothetical protein ALC62_12214, partial [Cyphomyrmex costatus]